MRRWGFIAALGFIVLVNAFIFIRLAYNRAGEPEAKVTLTGREVALEALEEGWQRQERGKERGKFISVRLNWDRSFIPWFGREKLEALGFDLNLPPYVAKEASRYYAAMLPRQAYVVLEYNGRAYEAWRRDTARTIMDLEERERKGELKGWEQKRLKTLKNSLTPASSHTRLFAVDAGRDPAALRRQYPERDRFFIAPALVRASEEPAWDEKTRKTGPLQIKGLILYLLVDHIYLSDQHREVLAKIFPQVKAPPEEKPWVFGEELRARDSLAPEKRRLIRFTICSGKSCEPWVADIRLEEEAK